MDMLTPSEVKALLSTTREFALVDVRERGEFSRDYQLLACSIPLSSLELLIGDLVPCRATPIVLVDDGGRDERAATAARRLASLGYDGTRVMSGGLEAWKRAGYETFSGVNVLSKTFGEMVEIAFGTPRLTPEEVLELRRQGRRMINLDARPFEEYQRMTIPGSISCPGGELVLRIADLAPDPDTLVVVNCAGRTRSIIGTQSLRNAGIPNPVAALKGGTMNWTLSGLELEYGAARQAPLPSETAVEVAQGYACAVRRKFGVARIDMDTLDAWRKEADTRTLYLLDVRLPGEFEAGHLPGSRNAPGGQLVQATDEYVGMRNGRVVLVDDNGVRATMAASWLMQMGYSDVHVLESGLSGRQLEKGPRPPVRLGVTGYHAISAQELAEPAAGRRLIIDMGSSRAHRAGHVPGAVWVTRSRLALAGKHGEGVGQVVLVSEDGLVAGLAAGEAEELFPQARVVVLAGGTLAWSRAGKALEQGMSAPLCPEDDQWYKPYEDTKASRADMQEYLDWEVALVERARRDGDTHFLLPDF